jgi:hypothetical protein
LYLVQGNDGVEINLQAANRLEVRVISYSKKAHKYQAYEQGK